MVFLQRSCYEGSALVRFAPAWKQEWKQHQQHRETHLKGPGGLHLPLDIILLKLVRLLLSMLWLKHCGISFFQRKRKNKLKQYCDTQFIKSSCLHDVLQKLSSWVFYHYRTVKREELFWPWTGLCLTSILLLSWMSLDSFSLFCSQSLVPCVQSPNLSKTFSSGICREGEKSQFSDIKEGINNYSKMGHLKNSAIEQIWTLSTSPYAIKAELKQVSRLIFYKN